MAGLRRKARVIALQALYEADCVGHEAGGAVNRLVEEAGLSAENTAFALELADGVVRNREEIDNKIKEFAPTWPIWQIPAVDRNILRLAIFEILLNNKVPVGAVINEAVELAKVFGGESSPKFINGVLGSVGNLAKRQIDTEVESGKHL